MDIIFLIIGLVVGALAAFLIAKFKYEGARSKVEEKSNYLENELSETETELK